MTEDDAHRGARDFTLAGHEVVARWTRNDLRSSSVFGSEHQNLSADRENPYTPLTRWSNLHIV